MPIFTVENVEIPTFVTLDGERLDDCVYADTDKGIARVHAKDENGAYKINGGELVIEELTGLVCVVDAKGNPAKPLFEVQQ